jgi:hypothetical protein
MECRRVVCRRQQIVRRNLRRLDLPLDQFRDNLDHEQCAEQGMDLACVIRRWHQSRGDSAKRQNLQFNRFRDDVDGDGLFK